VIKEDIMPNDKRPTLSPRGTASTASRSSSSGTGSTQNYGSTTTNRRADNHHGAGRDQRDNRDPAPALDTSCIQLEKPVAELFDTIADNTACVIAKPQNRDHNKSTQLRGFYDEILMWEQKTRSLSQEQFDEVLPLIRMINARVAYTKGRNLVDQNFFDLVRHCLQQVNSPATMRNCKLFMEAFMGFFKVHGR
jgi:CRISPR-associated protein Csm2